ncbi:MAG: EF-hand domain-containing protein [Desulfobaccales bacterium]
MGSLIKYLTCIFTVLIVAGAAWVPVARAVPPRTEKSQTALFNTYDRNHDGKITLQEFLDLNGCRNPSCRERLTKTFRQMDLNGDGVITLEEFLAPVRGKSKK